MDAAPLLDNTGIILPDGIRFAVPIEHAQLT